MLLVIGEERLHDRPAANLTASGSPGDLRQQLERSLPRPKISMTETDVGRDYADERHSRKIMPLGNHLRTDQHIQFAPREPRQ